MSRDLDWGKRLLVARQFSAVFGSPTDEISDKHVLLLTRENGLDHPRLGLVIDKKGIKLVAQRNRLKRLTRESFHHNQKTLAGWDIVMITRKGPGELEDPKLHQQSSKFWRRLLRNRPRTESLADAPGVTDGTHAQVDVCASRSLQRHPPLDDLAPSFPAKLYFPDVRGRRAAWPAT